MVAVLYWYIKQAERTQRHTFQPKNIRATDWGAGIHEPGTQQQFYGRTEELATLTNWCLDRRCRTISLIGMGGMGKSALAWEFAHQVECHFDFTIWRSLLNPPSAAELCSDLLRFLMPHSIGELPASIDGQITLLIERLKRNRCLLIF
ncbi:MAG: ATP-binding protein [Chamaesiphon sp. CSU_1_12]|nr:ATP-binding protein [Chamaesiphon sp. CSU_1_12]